MAQNLYDPYKEDLISTGMDLSSVTLRVIFVTTTYTFSAAHQFFSDLTNTVGDGGTGRTNGEILAGKSVTSGVFDATDPVFASVTGTNIGAFVLYEDTGVDGTSRLLGYFDSIGTFTVSGAQVTINFDAAGVFSF
jgi:hypothetical protein